MLSDKNIFTLLLDYTQRKIEISYFSPEFKISIKNRAHYELNYPQENKATLGLFSF